MIAFGKTRATSNKKVVNSENNLNQEEKDEELLKRQSSKIEEQINVIKSQKLGRAGSVFKMREAICGPKKKGQEPNAIKNPKTGDLVVSSEEIKKVTLAYCVENLTNNNPDEEVKQLVDIKKQLHESRMKDTESEGFEVKKESFGKASFENKHAVPNVCIRKLLHEENDYGIGKQIKSKYHLSLNNFGSYQFKTSPQ